MTSKKKKVSRAKYSVLCLKRAKLKDAIVFVQKHNVWAIVKGKEYVDGRFKYVYNGHEAIADPYKCIPMRDGLTKPFLKSEVVRLNMNHLQTLIRPKKRKLKARWMPEVLEQVMPDDLNFLLGDVLIGDDRPAPIVAEEQ
jgi:hypothetical protein